MRSVQKILCKSKLIYEELLTDIFEIEFSGQKKAVMLCLRR